MEEGAALQAEEGAVEEAAAAADESDQPAPPPPPRPLILNKRCGQCRACLHPQWKTRCERNAALAAAAGLPVRRRGKSALAAQPARSPVPRSPPPARAPAPRAADGVAWPERPRRPKNAFLLFAEGFQRAYRAEHAGASFAAVAEATGAAWKALGAEARAPLEAEASAAAAAHAAARQAFAARVAQLTAAGHALPPQLQPKTAKRRRASGGVVVGGETESESDDGEVRALERWEACGPCARWTVVAFDAAGGAPRCAECGAAVALTGGAGAGGAALESWVQCDLCGKWRSLSRPQLRALAAAGAAASWTCAMRHPGATCKSGADEWGSVRGRQAKASAGGAAAAAGAAGLPLAPRAAAAAPGAPREALRWVLAGGGEADAAAAAGPSGAMHGAPAGGVRPATRCEFVPGWDELVSVERLAVGVDAFDSRAQPGEGPACEPLLWTAAVPLPVLRLGEPFVTAAIAAYYAGRLPELRDGRESSGPVDVHAFLAEPRHAEALEAALFRRKARLAAAAAAGAAAAAAAGAAAPAAEPSRTRYSELNFVVHVKHNQRAVYIGEEEDLTANGNSIMGFNKSWKGNPIRSWSGGMKMADMPGAQPNKLVQSRLSGLLSEAELHLLSLAAQLWALFAERSPAAAARQLAYLEGPRAASQLGGTGWNAYSFNLDYATAAHYDCKNVAGSYSCLAVAETGQPFCGCLYLLPQYRVALELRQGVALFHRSGDAEVGMHANSGLRLPEPASHRVALVFYLTSISAAAAAAAGLGEASDAD